MSQLFFTFLKLGCIAFGGPVAHIAILEEEIVEKRKWITTEQFLSFIGLTQLIPGPNSTELILHIGYARGGIKGLLAAGSGFLLPAISSTLALAFVYVNYGSIPIVAELFQGIQAVVLVIIFSALLKLAKKQYNKEGKSKGKDKDNGKKSNEINKQNPVNIKWIVSLLVLICLAVLGIAPWWLILIGGVFYFPLKPQTFTLAPIALSLPSISSKSIFIVFFKIGAILFGSGYVLVAYLEEILVKDLGWLNHTQLLDSIALGQFTPGPVLSTATFIGYILNSGSGALAATFGIFLPAFILVSLSGQLIYKLNNKVWFKQSLVGVNLAALAIFMVAFVKLCLPVYDNVFQLGVVALSAILHFKFKVKAPWLILIGAVAGIGYTLIG